MSEKLYFNGINGATGDYGFAPQTAEELVSRIRHETLPPDNLGELKEKLKIVTRQRFWDVILPLCDAALSLDDMAARATWCGQLLRELAGLPLSALELLADTQGLIQEGLQALHAALLALPVTSTKLSALRATVVDLQTRRVKAWDEVLAALDAPLRDLCVASDTPWPRLLSALNMWLDKMRERLEHLGVIAGVDPTDMAQAGWGVIFAAGDNRVRQIKDVLAPLLAWRRAQAGERYRVFDLSDGYRPNDTARTFLARRGADAAQPVDPEKVPYYLLLVGDPEQIPFDFQHQLDVQYAVGRIDFGDDLAAYANYARSVIAIEREGVRLARRAAFFGVANPDDRATSRSAEYLIHPLYERLAADHPDWAFTEILRADATKARLSVLLKDEAPAFWFTASHGMEFPADDPRGRQRRGQGALLCQDWPGPEVWRGEIPPEHYLSGEDFAPGAPLGEANLLGSIAFFFACYSAGTPRFDQFARQTSAIARPVTADPPFVAALPQAMLSLSRGGALAVIGHVERTWGTSFMNESGAQIAVFQSAIARLLAGVPVGEAMDFFNGRYAALSTQLTEILDDMEWGGQHDPYDVARLWTENNDARGYIILGDPAVRLPVARADETVTGPVVIESAPVAAAILAPEKPAPTRPAEISEADWEATPLSVREYIQGLNEIAGF